MKSVLGTMTFGDPVDQDAARDMIELYRASSGDELDTAHVYTDGLSESHIGAWLRHGDSAVTIASKVHPWNDQGLQPRQIRQQFEQSLKRLGQDRIDLLYLHSPDLSTPIRETLEACFELYRQGKFSRFGLSNYAAWQVAEIAEICGREGWMRPVVYQGMYNALTRDVERELIPCLRNYGIRFYAYNPLAGGLLTGKYRSAGQLPDDGRFGDNPAYQDRYWKQTYFDVLRDFAAHCESQGISPVEAAFGWLIHHSVMRPEFGDAIILGASRIDQLRQNLDALNADPLDPSIITTLDRGWSVIKADCASYFRT